MTVKSGLLWKARSGIVMMFFFTLPSIAPAQNWVKVITGLWKTHQAMSITDEKLAEMVAEEVAYMDSQHKVLGESNAYTKRLKRVMSGITAWRDWNSTSRFTRPANSMPLPVPTAA